MVLKHIPFSLDKEKVDDPKASTEMKHTKRITNIFFLLNVMVFVVLMSVRLMAQDTTLSSSTTSTGQNNSSSSTNQNQNSSNGYEIKSSIEVGARGIVINGSDNKYRSDLNYRPGFRLFDSSFLVTAKETKGKPFDSLLVTGTGWNADPNGYTRINVEKVGWYRFDSTVRRFTYFNNLQNLALNQHNRNTKHTMGDFDLTFLPQNEDIKIRVGYSFDRNRGPATSTFSFSRDEYPLNSNMQSRAYDLRVGIDAKLLGFNISFTEGFRRYTDDTNFSISVPQLGNNPSPNSSIATFSRELPDAGRTFYHRFTVSRTFAKRLDFTGRFIYAQSTSRFSMLEKLTGRDFSGNTVVLDQFNVDGDSKRPNGTGDIGLTLFVTDKFRISNTFSVNSYRITGGNILLESLFRTNPAGATLPTVTVNTLNYRLTNYRRYINTIEGDYDFNRRFSAYLGYRYTNRRVTLNALVRNLITQAPTISLESQENTTNTVIGGFKLKPVLKKWTMYFDIEHGSADNVFTRLANYDFTTIRFRNRINVTDKFFLNLSVETKDNTNPSRTQTIPPRDFGADVNARIYSASFDWTPNAKVSLNGGYTYNRVTSQTAIIFPINNVIREGLSRYFLRDNYAFLDGYFQLHKRFTVFGGYRISKDTGNGDVFNAANYLIVGSYPLQFQSPEVRVIFKINRNIDWNVGYQFYDYKEKVLSNQNYRAHLPYTSLRIYFGNVDR